LAEKESAFRLESPQGNSKERQYCGGHEQVPGIEGRDRLGKESVTMTAATSKGGIGHQTRNNRGLLIRNGLPGAKVETTEPGAWHREGVSRKRGTQVGEREDFSYTNQRGLGGTEDGGARRRGNRRFRLQTATSKSPEKSGQLS